LLEAQRLFEQEAVRLDDLGKHNQIPELLAHCEQDGRQYLVQEFIDGENLLQELNRLGHFNEAKIKDLLLDLLPVLQFIHIGNVIHRDIKPENIIRRRSDGKLVLVDFGAAKIVSKTSLAKTGTTIGSAEYTAPEQARGKAIFASDIYSLGVTCIYLLTQISPFDLFSDLEGAWVWRQFLNGSKVNDQLGRILDRMIEQALGRRYQSVTEILLILRPSSPTKVQATNPAPNSLVITPPINPSPSAKVAPQKSFVPPSENSSTSVNVSPQKSFVLPSENSSTSVNVVQQPSFVPSSVSEFEFEYVLTKLKSKTVIVQKEEGGFLGIGKRLVNVAEKKISVELERKLGKAQYIHENLGNGEMIDLVRIPSGKFMMGSNELGDEQPVHEVTLQEFWIGKYAVTQKQWQAVMGNNPANFKGKDLPVENISWNDAMDFCERASQKVGNKVRLPTEAEWEYACRAGTTTTFHFGETITTDLVNYNGNYPYENTPKGQYREKTVDADAFYPNPWGLYQMNGNIWEWCLDNWHDDYSKKPLRLKQNGNEPWGQVNINKNYNRNHLARGGSWLENGYNCTSAFRRYWTADIKGPNLGLRVVLF